ncbi:MAG: DUF4845 domain-containing protein [Zoogloeaceae bacterium]|jgi:type II secretory pathway pseudopilin PulG|nr:DUF4845 domain-containing protein [Zoogloeaceae bacterium]
MKTRQGGFTLTSFVFTCVLVGIAAWLITAVSSSLLQHQDFKRIVKQVAANSASYRTVEDARAAYNKSAGLNKLGLNLSNEELRINKRSSGYVFEYSYESRAHLIANVSLVFEFKGAIP